MSLPYWQNFSTDIQILYNARMPTMADKFRNEGKFIDLFAGIGGFRLALESFGLKCVFSSELDKHAQKTYHANFGDDPEGDIRKYASDEIPRHNVLCAGFPCQSFSIAGKQKVSDYNTATGNGNRNHLK